MARKTALVHDWLVGLGGGEKVLEAMYGLYPSPLYVLLKDAGYIQNSFWKSVDVCPSFLQKIPRIEKIYRQCLPMFPKAIERFDLSPFDLILSSSHAAAKNVRTHEEQLHICYCNTPMRYAWDLKEQYLRNMTGAKRWLAECLLRSMRKWDYAGSFGVDHFIANSQYIGQRIQNAYGRPSTVIYPPVDIHPFQNREKRGGFYLTVSRLVPYKKVDLIVKTFQKFPSKHLVVIGDGPERDKIQELAGKNVEFLGTLAGEAVQSFLARARAFIFAAEEDFGIAPVEAQAAGTPVIAFGKGGALETVKEGVSGLFFSEQTQESLCAAIEQFEKEESAFDAKQIRAHALQFSRERFDLEYQLFVETKWEKFYANPDSCRRQRQSALAPLAQPSP